MKSPLTKKKRKKWEGRARRKEKGKKEDIQHYIPKPDTSTAFPPPVPPRAHSEFVGEADFC